MSNPMEAHMASPTLLDPESLYSQAELVPLLKKSRAWFERSRWDGSGPPFVKVGRLSLYRGADVLAWLEANRRTSKSQNNTEKSDHS